MGFLRVFKKWVLDALFPPMCVSCKREGDFLCGKCVDSLTRRKIRGGFGKSPRRTEFQNLKGLIYALDYAKNPQIQAAIKQFKYKFTEELALPFARLIVEKLGELTMPKGRRVVLVPVPLHPRRLRERGFNQAEVIARAIQKEWPGPCEIQNLLIRQKETSQQARLTKKERHENLADAFGISKECLLYCHSERLPRAESSGSRGMNKKFIHSSAMLGMTSLPASMGPQFSWGERNKGEEKYTKRKERKKGAWNDAVYFLVDDVCTTGATLENAAKVLVKGGFGRVYGLVIARAFK